MQKAITLEVLEPDGDLLIRRNGPAETIEAMKTNARSYFELRPGTPAGRFQISDADGVCLFEETNPMLGEIWRDDLTVGDMVRYFEAGDNGEIVVEGRIESLGRVWIEHRPRIEIAVDAFTIAGEHQVKSPVWIYPPIDTAAEHLFKLAPEAVL